MSPAPIRVAVTIGPTGHGGTASYSRELVRALLDRDDVSVVTVGTSAALAESGCRPDEHVTLPSRRVLEQASVATSARRLRRHDVDVVHGTRQLLPLRCSLPTVLTFHDDYVLTRPNDYDRIKRLLLPPLFRASMRRADAVITLHPDTAVTARSYVRSGVAVVDAGASVPSALSEATPTAPPGPALPERFALVVGDANPRKNVGALLDTWPAIESPTGLALVVAGGRVASPELLTRLRSGRPARFVHLPTWGELAHLYRHAALVVDPAHDEGFGFARIEAAHFGVPFVAAREHPDVATAVRSALDPARAGAAQSPPSWALVAERTVAVYRDVLGRPAE
jgi:glycosyltransferase involved in cell wall biosynthesis